MSADDTSREALIERVRGPLANVLYNASNSPDRAQVHILGADMRPLMDKAAAAVVDAVVMPLVEERDRLRTAIGDAWEAFGYDRSGARSSSVEFGPAGGPFVTVEEAHDYTLAEFINTVTPELEDVRTRGDAAIKRAEEAERRLAVAQERRDHWRRRFTDTAARATGLALNTHAATKVLDEYLAASDDDPHSTHDERCHERHERCLAHRVRNTLNPGDNPGKE